MRGDTPLHIATRSLAVEVIEEFSLLPEWQSLRGAENAESLLPIDLVSETSENMGERKCFHLLQEKIFLAIVEPEDHSNPTTIEAPKLITT